MRQVKAMHSFPTEDGDWEKFVDYGDGAWINCNDVADDLQPDCNDVADNLQPTCNNAARPVRRGEIKPLNPKLVEYLANDDNFKKASSNWFSNIEECVATQKLPPKYVVEHLNMLGFKVTFDDVARYYFPESRVERQKGYTRIAEGKIKVWQKISGVLLAVVLLMWFFRPHPTESRLTAIETTSSDSLMCWSDMIRFVKAYENGQTIFYPSSYEYFYEVLNKQQHNAKQIKELFDERKNLIEKNKKK